MNPAKHIAIDMALAIFVSQGCSCERTWDMSFTMAEELCVDCESVKKMLLRLGFVTRDEITHQETRLMGAWWEETLHGGDPVPTSEPLDENNTVMVNYVGSTRVIRNDVDPE